MQIVAQSWLVFILTDSAFYVGLVDALESIPILALSLYGGVIADRIPKRRLIAITQSCSMVLAFVLAAIVLADVATVGQVMVIATLHGVVNAFDFPARQALYSEVVSRDDLMNAIALNASAFNASRIVGPAIAGAVIGLFGVAACFLVNGVSYVAVLVGLFSMRVPAEGSAEAGPSAWSRIRAGLRHIAADTRMRTLFFALAVVSVFGRPLLVLLPIVAKSVLGRGAAEYGWMMSSVGIGAVAGGLAVATFAGRIPKGRVVAWSASAFGLLLIMLSLVRTLPLALVLLAAWGCTMSLNGSIANTLLQTMSPDALRGRVMSVYTFVVMGLAPLGALQAGAIAETLGAPVAMAIGGTCCMLFAGLVLLRSPKLSQTR